MKNIEQYRALTQQRNWMEIFKINGLATYTFSTEEEIGFLEIICKKTKLFSLWYLADYSGMMSNILKLV